MSLIPECCFNYKKGRRGGEGSSLEGLQESDVQIYGEHLHVLSLFEILMMSKHIASVVWTVFVKLKESTSWPYSPPQRDTALHICHKSLADLQEICGSVPICCPGEGSSNALQY